MDALSLNAYTELQSKIPNAGRVRREICSSCKQSIVFGSRKVGAKNRHDCNALDEQMRSYLLMYRCQRCGDVFTGMSNMGMHQCTHHPGIYTNDGYTCCGKKRIECNNPYVNNMVWERRGRVMPDPYEPAGCTPCDHTHGSMPSHTNTSVGEGVDVQVDLPEQIFALMEPLATSRPGFVVKNNKGLLVGRGLCPVEKRGETLLMDHL